MPWLWGLAGQDRTSPSSHPLAFSSSVCEMGEQGCGFLGGHLVSSCCLALAVTATVGRAGACHLPRLGGFSLLRGPEGALGHRRPSGGLSPGSPELFTGTLVHPLGCPPLLLRYLCGP